MSTLFFPLVPFLLQVIAVGWFMAVGIYLASSGERQYKFDVDCKSQLVTKDFDSCRVTELNRTVYSFATKCSTDQTYTCEQTGCEAHCRFYKFGPTTLASWFQVRVLFLLPSHGGSQQTTAVTLLFLGSRVAQLL